MKVQLKVANGAKSGLLVSINRPRFLIGRAEDCQLKPKSDLISRYHCAILSEDAYVAVRDLGSKNGVFLNGKRVEIEEELKNGDRLVIGPLEFEVVLTVALAAEKKPKVESVADVVARTVERQSSPSVQTKPSDGADASDWLMDDDADDVPDVTQTIKTEQLQKLGVAPEEKKSPAPQKKEPAPAPEIDPNAAANLLKNFFQEH